MAWTERYVRADAAGGADGTNDTTDGTTGAWTLAEAASSYAAGQRINIRAGSYANSAGALNFSTAATTTNGIWIRGFNTTPGDLDDRPTSQLTPGTDMPVIDNTTFGYVNFTGAMLKVTSIAFTSSVGNRPALYFRSNYGLLHRCRLDHSAARSTYLLDVQTPARNAVSECAIECGNASSTWPVIGALDLNSIIRCLVKSASTSADLISVGTNSSISGNLLIGGRSGVAAASAPQLCDITRNTFYGQDADCIKGIGPPNRMTAYCNLFANWGGYAVNGNNTGTAVTGIQLIGNAFYDGTPGTGRLNDVFESFELDSVIESSDPFVDAANDDFTVASGASSYGASNLFEKDGPVTYGDIGAIQHQDSVPTLQGQANLAYLLAARLRGEAK